MPSNRVLGSREILRTTQAVRKCQVRMNQATWGAVSVLILLTAIAFAGLPDPTWVPVIYDRANVDDVTETDASQGETTHGLRPPAVSSERVFIRETGTCESSLTLRASRGPPQPHPRIDQVLYNSPRNSPSDHLFGSRVLALATQGHEVPRERPAWAITAARNSRSKRSSATPPDRARVSPNKPLQQIGAHVARPPAER